jgi:hypothetical protein
MTKQTQHVENMYNFKYFFNILTYHKINNLLHTSIKLKNDQKIKEFKELKNTYITLFDIYPNKEIV